MHGPWTFFLQLTFQNDVFLSCKCILECENVKKAGSRTHALLPIDANVDYINTICSDPCMHHTCAGAGAPKMHTWCSVVRCTMHCFISHHKYHTYHITVHKVVDVVV